METARTSILGVALATAVMTAAAPAAADAPHPVEAGEFYLQASLALQEFDRPAFRQFQMYLDNSSQTGTGLITTANHQGHLVGVDLKSKKEVIPEVAVGYSFENEVFEGFDGNVRVEFTGNMYKTDTRGSSPGASPPANGFFIEDNVVNPGTYIEVGLYTAFPSIEGRDDNADGTQAGLLTSRSVTNIAVTVDEEQWRGGFMFYVDERFGSWSASRGMGLLYGYQTQDYRLAFNMPSLLASPDIAASLAGDDGFRYKYDITSHHLMFPFDFAVGRELLLGMSAFVSGTVTIGMIVNELEARQDAPCLTTCQLTPAGSRDYSRGTVRHNRSDIHFGYDTRGSAGVSWRIWKLRVTGEAGVFYTNHNSQPHEIEAFSPLQTQTFGYWGYFGKATATLMF